MMRTAALAACKRLRMEIARTSVAALGLDDEKLHDGKQEKHQRHARRDGDGADAKSVSEATAGQRSKETGDAERDCAEHCGRNRGGARS